MPTLQYETMMIVPRIAPLKLWLNGRFLVLSVSICWATKWHMRDSPISPTDYNVSTLGLDGIP